MIWRHDHYEWYYILIFSVLFGFAMSNVFDNLVLAISVGFLFGLSIALALGEKHRAKVFGGKLIFGVGDNVETIPLSEVKNLEIDKSNGEMVVQTHDGDTYTLDPSWDKHGLAMFVRQVKRKYRL